jgi:hypothetical protein
VTELAAALKLTHPTVSRRIAKLKATGRVDHGPNGWEVETQVAPKCPSWLKPIDLYARREMTTLLEGPKYG